MRTKRKSEAQIIGDKAVNILRTLLPSHWTMREYQPDYGLDLAIEVFTEPKADSNGYVTSDTLGEHFFVQVKGMKHVIAKPHEVGPRQNVERPTSQAVGEDEFTPETISVIPFQLETPELLTVQRMGAAVPVLLVLVDTTQRRAFFVCLNDYIDKILLPVDPFYAEQKSKVVHVPERNEIGAGPNALVPLLFYSKRAKLMAAFQKFAYQKNELDYTRDSDLNEVGQHFALILLRYDFWPSCEFWGVIEHTHRRLQDFLHAGASGIVTAPKDVVERSVQEGPVWSGDEIETYTLMQTLEFQAIRTLWDNLATLGRVHEEICREWFLPTYLGIKSSY